MVDLRSLNQNKKLKESKWLCRAAEIGELWFLFLFLLFEMTVRSDCLTVERHSPLVRFQTPELPPTSNIFGGDLKALLWWMVVKPVGGPTKP